MDLKKAAEVQRKLLTKLILKWDERDVHLVAGADFGYDNRERNVGASIVVFKIPEFELVEISSAFQEVKIPYIPGFLSFREGPVFLEAYRKMKNKPDVTLIDGNGIAHPRQMGLASFVGVVLDICTIGCAKSAFYPFIMPLDQRGAYSYFTNKERKRVGICLRTRDKAKPIFVSPGHRVDFKWAMKIVLNCSKFRIPEPLREAHKRARQMFQ